MEPHFIVHESTDTVGVVVVDIINAGEKVSGWVMETDENDNHDGFSCYSPGAQTCP